MNTSFIYDLEDKIAPEAIGKKATNLRTLSSFGIKIPNTLVVPADVFDQYKNNSNNLLLDLQTEISQKIDPSKSYAVRSSANIEDDLYQSYAGQFKTTLDVKGFDEILTAIQSTWDSSNSTTVKDYSNKMPSQIQDIKMAVVIQEMVPPIYSGVVFSKNPTTGTDEIVIEAVEGSGEKLVQSGITPYRWIYKWGNWIVKPDDYIIEPSILEQIVEGTRKIVKANKKPVDLEWVYNGNTVIWVQMRDITTNNQLNIYSNRISKEMMPGQIKPLIWSINIPLIITVWINLLKEMVGKMDIQAEDLAKRFYHRSYFNMATLGNIFNMAGFPSEGLEMMMGIVPKEAGKPVFKMNLGMLKIGPRLLHFFISKWRFSRRYKKEMPALIKEMEKFNFASISSRNLQDLIDQVTELFSVVQNIVYYNINVPLILSMYNNILSVFLKKKGIQPEHFDITFGIKELEYFTPTIFLKQLNRKFRTLDTNLQAKVLSSNYEEFLDINGIDEFKRDIESFLERFGHLSDNNNNFTAIPWREKPEYILKLICEFPDEIQTSSMININNLDKKSLFLQFFYKRTQQFYLFRDQTSNLYTYSYGLFRPYFLKIAEHFVEVDVLEEITDIFYLNWQEIQTIASSDPKPNEFKMIVKNRKDDMEKTKHVELPAIIFGDQPPPIIPHHSSILKGVPTSQGYYTGPVRKVLGIDDFSKVKQGDVLVVPYSDIGWSPLFAKAGAVVSESGGILSHSSIIAREFQIPAVVSVPNATKLLENQIISIDGYKGEIIIHEQENSGGNNERS